MVPSRPTGTTSTRSVQDKPTVTCVGRQLMLTAFSGRSEQHPRPVQHYSDTEPEHAMLLLAARVVSCCAGWSNAIQGNTPRPQRAQARLSAHTLLTAAGVMRAPSCECISHAAWRRRACWRVGVSTFGHRQGQRSQKEVQAAHLQAAISQSASSSVFGGLNR